MTITSYCDKCENTLAYKDSDIIQVYSDIDKVLAYNWQLQNIY